MGPSQGMQIVDRAAIGPGPLAAMLRTDRSGPADFGVPRPARFNPQDSGAPFYDVCFAPVLSFAEAPLHPQLKARGTFVEIDGVVQPAPAPRFGRSVPRTPTPPRDKPNTDVAGLLAAWREGR